MYYAIKMNNLSMVKYFLYLGASPWTPDYCTRNYFVISKDNIQIQRYLKLARRIAIALAMSYNLK